LDIEGWNEFDVNWQFANMFVLSHSFTNEISAAFDNSVPTLGLWYLSGNEGWQLSKSEDQYTLGVWGIRAYVNYSGIDVTYNIYRNGAQLASNLTSGSFIDEGVENNITYEYILDVVFENGAIAKDTLSITPIPLTIYELPAYDDGSFESELVLQDDDYSAVRFSAGSGDEDIFHFTWYQFGSGGHFKLIAWEDNNGTPGDEIDGLILNSQNYPKVSEWNSVSLPNQYITVSGDFWIGIKGLSLTRPIGIDTTSTSGNSFTRIGENGEWVPVVKGNLAYRVSLDSNPLSIVNSIIPIEFGLNEIYPNPFNPIANIQFAISEFAQVRLSIYDLNGRLVNILLDDILNPGNYTSVWNGADGNGYKVSSGIYLVVLDAEGKNIQTRKLVLLK